MATRPTADRLRESVFNILGERVRGARVLDLFAGTGALGLEALSRGARSCVFIDNQKPALAVIRKNIQALSMSDRCRVLDWDIARNLNALRAMEPSIDLVFMDPPYGKNLIEATLLHLEGIRCLAPGALLVCEHAATDALPDLFHGLALSDQRRYGKTTVTFLSYDPTDSSGP